MELELAPFDLRECIEAVVDLIGPIAQRKGLEITYGIETGTPETAVGDASRLRQILLNLLNNAVKFTEEGEVAVHVEAAEPRAQDRIAFRVSIRDTGIGIPPDRIDRLFQSFTQVDASTSRRFGGHRARPRDQPPPRRADGRHRHRGEQRRRRRGQHVPRHVRGGRDGHDADRAPARRLVRRAPSAHRRRQRDEPPADDRAPVGLGRRDDDRVLRRGSARRARRRAVRRRDRRHADAGDGRARARGAAARARARSCPRSSRRRSRGTTWRTIRRWDGAGIGAVIVKPIKASGLTALSRSCSDSASDAVGTPATPAGPRPRTRRAASAADPAGRGQRREPAARAAAAREAGLPGRRRRERARGASRRSSASPTTSS